MQKLGNIILFYLFAPTVAAGAIGLLLTNTLEPVSIGFSELLKAEAELIRTHGWLRVWTDALWQFGFLALLVYIVITVIRLMSKFISHRIDQLPAPSDVYEEAEVTSLRVLPRRAIREAQPDSRR